MFFLSPLLPCFLPCLLPCLLYLSIHLPSLNLHYFLFYPSLSLPVAPFNPSPPPPTYCLLFILSTPPYLPPHPCPLPPHLLVTLWLLMWACGPAWQRFACVACLTFIQIQRKGSVHPIRVSRADLKGCGGAFLEAVGVCLWGRVRGVWHCIAKTCYDHRVFPNRNLGLKSRRQTKEMIGMKPVVSGLTVFYHIKKELPRSSHVWWYVLCRNRATPSSLLSKTSYEYYMIHLMCCIFEVKQTEWGE